jgi:hypothetical protein
VHDESDQFEENDCSCATELMMWRLFKILLLLCASVIAPIASARDEVVSREYQVKAAMICNFAQFVEWPHEAFDSESSPLVIQIVGENPFGNVLEQLAATKQINGRSIVVKYTDSLDKIGKCQVMFISASEQSNLPVILDKVKSQPVLTLGETDSFPGAGGMIRFFQADGKVHFEVNLSAAEAAHLKISSKLLKLARIFQKQRSN